MAATRHYKFFDRTTGHTFLAEGTTESTALRLAMASRIESFGVSSSADMRAAMLNGDAVYDINGMPPPGACNDSVVYPTEPDPALVEAAQDHEKEQRELQVAKAVAVSSGGISKSQADAIERAAQTAAQAAGNDLDDDAEAAADKRARKVVAAESGAPL